MPKKEIFNPVKQDEDGKIAKRMIWSTQSINLAIQGLIKGKKLIANPFYENNIQLNKGDLVFERSDEEKEEWLKCANDIIYFAEHYCQLLTPEGVKKIKLRDYQIEYLNHLEHNRLSICLAARQCGKTTTSAIFALWYIIFNVDKNALIVANKYKTAKEILDKLKSIYMAIPHFLKPGIYKWNESEIVLDNGCRLSAEATTINSGIGMTLHCVIWDEAAHVAPNIVDTFYNNLFPTITAANARFIICSTQNGYNLFYKLYMAATAGESDYKSFKIDWYMVPDWDPVNKCWVKRDEKWRQRQIANYGSESAFNSQFGTEFDVSTKTLISNKFIRKLRTETTDFIEKDIFGVSYSNFYYWDPDYEPMERLKNDHIVITCDISEGGGGDYTVFMINRIINDKLESVGYFRSNELDINLTSLSLQQLCLLHCSEDRYMISIEYNTYGELFYYQMKSHCDEDEANIRNFDLGCIVKYSNNRTLTSNKLDLPGIRITSGNKTTACILFTHLFERNEIINKRRQFLLELEKFCDDGTGHYKASFGHDDIVMSMVQLVFVINSLKYKTYKESMRQISTYNKYTIESYNPYDFQLSGNNQNRLR